MKRFYEVRCCCEPQILLGWLPGPDARQITYPLLPMTRRNISSINLPVDTFNDGRRHYKAIKADGVPLETLRKIPGFIEACQMPCRK